MAGLSGGGWGFSRKAGRGTVRDEVVGLAFLGFLDPMAYIQH